MRILTILFQFNRKQKAFRKNFREFLRCEVQDSCAFLYKKGK